MMTIAIAGSAISSSCSQLLYSNEEVEGVTRRRCRSGQLLKLHTVVLD